MDKNFIYQFDQYKTLNRANTVMKRIYVKVSPKSSRNEVVEVSKKKKKEKRTAAPVDGKPNEALIKILVEKKKKKKRGEDQKSCRPYQRCKKLRFDRRWQVGKDKNCGYYTIDSIQYPISNKQYKC